MENSSVKVFNEEINRIIRTKDGWMEFYSSSYNLYLPKSSIFNARFISQVLSGEKFLLPLSAAQPPILKQSKYEKSFDRPFLLNMIKNDCNMAKYIPEQMNYKNSERSFLLAVSILSIIGH